MTTKSEFSVLGLAHKLGLTWERQGGTLADMNTLAEDSGMIRNVLSIIRGKAEIKILPCTIDCSVEPMIPDGLSLHGVDQLKSRFKGELVWSPEKVRFHLDPAQEGKKWLRGFDLTKKLEGQPVLPANILDFLLEHPVLIPLDWKGKYIYFWGTIYRRSDGHPCVRYLHCDPSQWYCDDDWLAREWDPDRPAALLA